MLTSSCSCKLRTRHVQQQHRLRTRPQAFTSPQQVRAYVSIDKRFRAWNCAEPPTLLSVTVTVLNQNLSCPSPRGEGLAHLAVIIFCVTQNNEQSSWKCLQILSKLIDREHLSFKEAEQSLDLILHEGGAPEQIAAFLVLLAAKGACTVLRIGAFDCCKSSEFFPKLDLKDWCCLNCIYSAASRWHYYL